MDSSSITGPLWKMINCCCGCLNQKAAYVYDLEENLRSLKEKWEKVEEKKKTVEENIEAQENAGERQRSHQVNGWLNRVEKTQQEKEKILVRGTKEIQNKCLSKCCLKNCTSSYKLGEDVAKILRNVDDLETEGKSLCEHFEIMLKLPHKSNVVPSSETVGLDLMFDKVWRSIEEENVGVIGLYGMGGVGKTTLLKKINNELAMRSDSYIMWVVVSKSPNLDRIMDSIRKLVGIGDGLWSRCHDQDVKAAKINKVLKEKNFVLLLDDIWKRLDLEKIGVPHPEETNFQSKVLFTTRREDVCAKMKAQRKFKVETLTEKEALELFRMKVGEETLNCHPIIPKLAEEMAKECKRLPLALTVIGSSMAGVKSVETWEDLKDNLRSSSRTASNLETEVFSVLKFSYDQLLDETHKKCFLYCALYPKDDEIQVYYLINQWIGEGFLYDDGMRSVHEIRRHGISIIDNLKLSCLLEYVEGDIFLKRSIKMHDVIRDMALWIACDEDRNKRKVIVQEDAWALSQNNFENWEMVERISIMNIDDIRAESSIQLQGRTWTNLTTLILKFHALLPINGLQNVQHARQLKVLELCGVENVPAAEIGGLHLLEYLSLRLGELTNASDIWRELKNLKNLKVLHLFLFGDNDTPLGLISNLHQLKVYRLDTGLRTFITGLDEREGKKFQELELSSNLEEVWVGVKSKSSLNILFESAKLQSCIYGLEIDRVQINMPLFVATMSKMKYLQCLVLKFLPTEMDPSVYDACCLSMLRTVEILDVNTIHHLTWLKYAPLLQELSVRQCSSIEEVIKGEIFEDDEKDTIFPSLVVLDLFLLPNLRRIHERALSFPSLRSINVRLCENLKKLPFDSNSAKAKLRHIKGYQSWWDNLEWDDSAIKATFQSKFQDIDY